MTEIARWLARAGALFNEGGPWGGKGNGGSGGDGGSGGGSGGGPRNPWTQPPGGGRPRGPRSNSAVDELSRRLRDQFGGNFPGGNGGPMIRYAIMAVALLWVLFSSFHRIGPQQEGVITRFGSYAGKISPGVGMTFPAPIDRVQKVDVQEIKTIDIPDGASDSVQNLILTGDQNIVDLAYSVRWGVKYSEFFLFQMAKPDETIREVAESAMREVMSTVTLADAFGPRRSQIEQQVALRMQRLLDDYKAGVTIRGVAIKKADPPAVVNDAFKSVTAAQQAKQGNINNANTYAQQILARAQGDATSFDKVYEQYRLAPDVTRRRMYYETMEAVLSNTDKTIVDPSGVVPYLPLGQTRPRVTVEEPSK